MNSQPSPLISRDKLNGADKDQVAKACVRIFDTVQTLTKEVQLLAMAGAFVILAQSLHFPAQDAFVAVKNLMASPLTISGLDHRFDAMLYHAKEDLGPDAPDVI